MVKVSVVIPVYNVEDFLGECLDSIVNQTLSDIEIICVNDGSKDKSLEILNEYAAKDERITVIDQENGGHAVATNNGMKLAKGKYLFLMDSDDILDLKALEETYTVAEERNVDFVIFQAINYYMDTGELVEAENYSMNELAERVGDSVFNYEDVEDLVFDITVTPWSKLYNRQFIEDNNITFPEGLVFDDNVFFFEVLFAAERITFLKKHLFKRRWYSTSSTTSGARHFIDYIKITDLIWEIFFRYDIFDRHIRKLGSKKVFVVYSRYKEIKDEFKEEYYETMKADFERIASDERFCEHLYNNLSDFSKKAFRYVLKSKDHEEFILLSENLELSRENERLVRENKKLNKLNSKLTNSNSWKVTQKLRRN